MKLKVRKTKTKAGVLYFYNTVL